MMFRLSVSAIAFYQTQAFEINGAAQQINGRAGNNSDFVMNVVRYSLLAWWRFRPTSSQPLDASCP
jgi:hypothetical protein